MLTIILQALKRWRGQILGWGCALSLTALYLMWLYEPMLKTQADLNSLFDAYGAEMLAFFGGTVDIISPGGYLNFTFFSYIPLVSGILALLLGSGLLVGDEEKGTLDLTLAYPVSRSALFWGRLLALVFVLAGTLSITWAGFALGSIWVTWEVSIWEMLLPHLSLLATMIWFAALALFLSLLLPSRTAAASLSGMLLVASYFITSLASVNEKLETVSRYSPLTYYQGGLALNEGLIWGDFLGTLSAAFVLAALAWLMFLRRDIRVSGEGTINLGGYFRRRSHPK